MKRRILLPVALLLSLLGVFSLILLAEFSEPELIHVAELEDKVEQIVLVQGEITKVTQKLTVNFFELKDETGTITVVSFGEMQKLERETKIQIRGKVVIYKGDLEVIADLIEVLND